MTVAQDMGKASSSKKIEFDLDYIVTQNMLQLLQGIISFRLFGFGKKRMEKRLFFQSLKVILFPTGLWCEFDSWHVFRHSGALSKKCNFATLGSLQSKL